MITTEWVLPLAFFAGVGVSALGFAILLAHINARIDLRVLDALERYATAAPDPDPGLPPAVDPWSPSSLRSVHEGLPVIDEPEMPAEHTWWGMRTGSLPIVPVAEAAEVVAEVLADEPKPNPRKRFNTEPKAPAEVAVTTIMADPADADAAEVRSELVEVQA